MILRQSTLKAVPKKKRVSLSAMLASEHFFHRSIQIQMALNQDRILPRDYLIQKAKPKINTGKKKKKEENQNKEIDSSFEANKEKDNKDIPDELEKILNENQKKFAIENKKYQTLKEYNDVVSGVWHYINRKTKKDERELLFKRYFNKDDKNIINLYDEHLQKFCLNTFKSNPLLMRKKNAEMFFHYLSEFNKYYKDENKLLYVKKKIIDFLEKLRDFLEFVKIKADSSLDSISKDIKIKNSKFVKEVEIKIKQELKSLKEKNRIINEKDIKESEKMINKTKETLKALFENKNIFEDPSYFDPTYNVKYILKSRNMELKYKYNYNNNISSMPNISKNINNNNSYNNNNYSPNKTAKMSTMSTGFFMPDKNKNANNEDIKDSEILINDTAQEFKKIKIPKNKRFYKGGISNSNTLPKKNKLKDLLNIEQKNKKKITKISVQKSIETEKNSLRESLSSSINFDYNKTKYRIKKVQNNLNNNNNISSHRRSEEENIIKIISNQSSSKMINFRKKSLASSISANKEKDNSKESENFRKKSIGIKDNDKIIKINKQDSDKKNDNKDINERASGSSFLKFKKIQSFNYDLGKDPVIMLYENIKDKPKIKPNDVDKINNYIKKSGKKLKKNLKSMDLIIQAKRITDRLDIERKTKKVFQPHLSYEQLKRLNSVKEINKELYKLDVDYMNHIFYYKSKKSDSMQILYN